MIQKFAEFCLFGSLGVIGFGGLLLIVIVGEWWIQIPAALWLASCSYLAWKYSRD